MERIACPVADLRDWLERAAAIGELRTVAAPVDPVEEMGAVAYLAAKRAPSPAVLFDSGGGAIGLRHLWNIFGPSTRRTAITLEEPPDLSALELIRRTKDKLGRRIPPREVSRGAAPVFESTLVGDEIDLRALPIPQHWPHDGGRYAGTADAVFTRDPDAGTVNIGTYRMMVQGPRHVGLCMAPGKDALAHMHRAWDRGEGLAVAAAWGMDPLLMVVGSQPFPRGVSEYDHAGGIKGAPVEVTAALHSDLLIPASAEIVIEGVIRPGARREEGPFGEFTGYYGFREENCPLVEVTALHHRRSPILTNALMADYPSNEQGAFFSTIRSARVWNDLDAVGLAGVCGVYAHPAAAGGFGMLVVSLNQRYAGHAAQALSLAAQVPSGAYITKWVVAVDEDVDPTDIDQVLWAMSTRCNPSDDLDLLRNTRGSPLDPSQDAVEDRFFGSKALVNACRNYRTIRSAPKRTLLRRSVYDGIAGRWAELGFEGRAPALSTFEPTGE